MRTHEARRKLERLAEKYRVLAELRRSRELLEAEGKDSFPAGESAKRSRAFRRVAREFPGALRELEHSTSEELEGRLHAVEREAARLDAGPGEGASLEGWIAVVLEYHDLLREALAVKLWLAGAVDRRQRTTESFLERFRSWHREHPERHTPTRRFDRPRLDLYRFPPGGRLHGVVWRLLEERFGRSRGELERLVFSPPAGGPGPGGPG